MCHGAVEVRPAAADRERHVRGRALSLIPLRNRRHDPATGELLVTRISGLAEWTVDGVDLPGCGLSEHLDQLIDGRPAGIGEEGGPARHGGRARGP